MKRLLLFVGIALLATSASAQFRTKTVATLDAARCTSGELENKDFKITDGLTGVDCTSGGGAIAVLCTCDGGVYRALNGSLSAVAATDFLPVSTTGSAALAATVKLAITTPLLSTSGVIERNVANVTGADDAAGTKPAVAIPLTTDFATCTCNDATGCTATIAEPTPTAGYGRSLTVVSIGTGNCEFADVPGAQEVGTTLVVEPTSVITFVYLNSAWHNIAYKDNVP
mgnify:CR=1 FL=1